MRLTSCIAALAAAMFTIGSCSSGGGTEDLSGTFFGPQVNLGNGTARSWVSLDASGNPTELGLRLSSEALSGLPEEMAESVLTLPAEAAATGFKEIGLDWNPAGHEPDPIYGLAHFDFHFYRIDEAGRAAITPGSDEQFYAEVPAANIPAGYALSPGSGVPNMGAHWGDPASPEFHGETFTATFIYGFYDAKMVFLEPMVTRDFLAAGTDFSAAIGQPAAYAEAGYYPDGYAIRHNDGNIDIVLSGLESF